VIVIRQLSRRGLSPLGDSPPATAGPGCSVPVPCGRNHSRYRLRSALSPRVGRMKPRIPKGYTARSHHPHAVEHRDCPPCGGDRVISHGIGGWGWMATDPAVRFRRSACDTGVRGVSGVSGFRRVQRPAAVILGLDPRIFLRRDGRAGWWKARSSGRARG